MNKITFEKLKKPLKNAIYPIVAVALFIGIWAIYAAVKDKAYLYPTPNETLGIFFRLGGEEGFWKAVFGSILRTLLCFLIAFVSAFSLAALGGLFPPLHKLLTPVVSFLRSVPTMAVILLIMLWLDYQNAPLFIGFLIAFPLLYSAFYTAITGVDRELLEMSKLYKVSAKNRVLRVYLPEIAPAVFDVSASTASLTLKVVIAAEVLCYTKNSIGINMIRANQSADIAYLLAWTLLAVILSFVLELAFVLTKRLSGVEK